ncbi:MAG: slipin family protein [Sediminibacterium sp.]|nr:slipin family protein [Sediminibacterium sp.]
MKTKIVSFLFANKITVNEGKVALVFKKGNYKYMLTAGNHYVKSGLDVQEYDMTKVFISPVNINLLLRDQTLVNALQIIDVKPHEIALCYENGQFKEVWPAGQHIFWKGLLNREFKIADFSANCIPDTFDKNLLQRRELSGYVRSYLLDANEKSIAFADGKFLKVLGPGIHFFWKNTNTLALNKAEAFVKYGNLSIMLEDEGFAREVDVVDVGDQELVLAYEKGILKEVLNAGQYAFWKNVFKRELVKIDMKSVQLPTHIDERVYTHPALLPYLRTYTVEASEKAVLYLDGKFTGILDPGMYYFWKNQIPVQLIKADMRTQQMEIGGQEILTKDKAALRVNFYVHYQIEDLIKAVVDNKEHDKQLYVLMQLALREFIGSLSLDELLSRKEEISGFIRSEVAGKTAALGIRLQTCGIRDIILPGEMKDIMNQVLIAEKKAQANTIMRREETASTRSLLNTAKLMEENTMLFKLKEMEYVEKIAEKISSISVTGGSQISEQLKQLFVSGK